MNIHPSGHHNPGLMFVLAVSVGIGVLVTSVAQADETVPGTILEAMPGASQVRSVNTSLVARIIEQLISLNPDKKIHNWVPGKAFSQSPMLSFTTLLPAHIKTQPDELAGYLSVELHW